MIGQITGFITLALAAVLLFVLFLGFAFNGIDCLARETWRYWKMPDFMLQWRNIMSLSIAAVLMTLIIGKRTSDWVTAPAVIKPEPNLTGLIWQQICAGGYGSRDRCNDLMNFHTPKEAKK